MPLCLPRIHTLTFIPLKQCCQCSGGVAVLQVFRRCCSVASVQDVASVQEVLQCCKCSGGVAVLQVFRRVTGVAWGGCARAHDAATFVRAGRLTMWRVAASLEETTFFPTKHAHRYTKWPQAHHPTIHKRTDRVDRTCTLSYIVTLIAALVSSITSPNSSFHTGLRFLRTTAVRMAPVSEI
jgi:hypothetical protein